MPRRPEPWWSIVVAAGLTAGCPDATPDLTLTGSSASSSSAGGAGGSSATSSGSSASSSATASSGGGGCDAAAANPWAEWPMPNPLGTALPHSASYDTNTPGVVLDNVTGLLWQRDVDPSTYTWGEAKDYCADLVLAGHCDWHLPSRIELVSIADYTKVDPAIDEDAFPNTPPSSSFWTSSPVANSPAHAWYVASSDGGTYNDDIGTLRHIRCVR